MLRKVLFRTSAITLLLCTAQCGPQGGDALSITHQALETAAFQNTGALPRGQSVHTETLLTDNTVLLTGGVSEPFLDYARPAQGISVIYNPGLGTFSFRGSMSTQRALHTATRLNNGQVLIAGGENNGDNSLATSELYNPGTGLFTLTAGSMSVARQGHTATLLNDGTVLVVGGYSTSGGGLTPTAEIYNPATGTWQRTAGNLAGARQVHTATLLSNGRVLIAGGYGAAGALASAEIYDPTTGTFSSTGSLRQARFLHRAVLLGGGRVLVAGGGNFDSLASAELYDPNTGAFSLTGSMASPRQLHSITLLGNGQVLVAGGSPSFQSQTTFTSAELYDPIGGQFRPAGDMAVSRERHTATALPSGQVLIAGGHNTANALTAELYTPTGVTVTVNPPSVTVALGGTTTFTATVTGAASTGASWSVSAGGGSLDRTTTPDSTTVVTYTAPTTPGTYTVTAASSDSPSQFATSTVTVVNGLVTVAHSTHTATLLANGSVLIAGGTDTPYTDYARPAQARVDLFDPARGLISATGSMNSARVLHCAALLNDGRVLVMGGEQTGSDSLASAETYNPGTGLFSNTGSMSTARQGHSCTLLGNGNVLVVGGYNGNTGQILASAELYNPGTGTFTATGGLSVGRQLHSATSLSDGRVLILGGINGDPLASAEIYDPTTGTFTVTGSLVTARFLHRATGLSDGRVLVTGGSNSLQTGGSSLASCEVFDPTAGTFSATGSLSSGRQLHSATRLSDGRVAVIGGSNAFQSLSALSSVEIYNPGTGAFSAGTALTTARERHSATLLNDGRVFIVGGHSSSSALTAEIASY